MRISAQFAMWGAAVFAVMCLGVALQGFTSLDGLAGEQLEDALGFAWFWLFLGAVGALVGFASWWAVRTTDEDS